MSEGILLDDVARDVRLSSGARLLRLQAAKPQILAALEGETDAIAVQATLACLLYQTIHHANFCGFYRLQGDTLTIGPYQGSMGCLRIDVGRGVCGKAVTSGKVQRVPDVHAFPGHISCDARSRSEIVLPVRDAYGKIHAVLDIDSPFLDAFSEEEALQLAELLHEASKSVAWSP
jgi:L-methionine (R)-S-oxide reductase